MFYFIILLLIEKSLNFLQKCTFSFASFDTTNCDDNDIVIKKQLKDKKIYKKYYNRISIVEIYCLFMITSFRV